MRTRTVFRTSRRSAFCPDFVTAKPVIEDYVERKPNDAEGLKLKEIVCAAKADMPEAQPILSRAVALKPNSYDAHYNLGFVLAKLGRAKEARERLEKALQLNPASRRGAVPINLGGTNVG